MGFFYPFKDGAAEINDGDEFEDDEKEILANVEIDLRLGWSDGDDPLDYTVIMYVNCWDNGTRANLIDLLSDGFDGTRDGPDADIIALTKLRAGIDEIIASLVKGKA